MSSAGARPNPFAVLLPDSLEKNPTALYGRLQAGRPRKLPRRALERRTMQLLADGLTTAQIARQLGYGPASIQACISDLMCQHGARSRAHLIAIAIRAAVIT